MTFPLVKPGGWNDNVDPITGVQMSQVDAHQSLAIDGLSGGSYSPSSALVVGGSGLQITNCVNHNVRGPYTLGMGAGVQASIAYRVDRATLDFSATTERRIDTSKDIYYTTAPITAAPCDVILNVLNTPWLTPPDGAIVTCRKHVNIPGPQTDSQNLRFYNSQNTSSELLCTIPGLNAISAPQANGYIAVSFVFSSNVGAWQVLQADPQVSI